MKDIKKIAKEYRAKNGNEKISNKELLWFMISKFDDLEERIIKVEAKQKMLMWLVPIIIGITAIIVGVI